MLISLLLLILGLVALIKGANLIASLNNNPEIAIGNILGSNIANILLILGAIGIIAPIIVKKNTVWKEIPLALLASLVLLVMTSDIILTESHTDTLKQNRRNYLTSFLHYLSLLHLWHRQSRSRRRNNTQYDKLGFRLTYNWGLITISPRRQTCC